MKIKLSISAQRVIYACILAFVSMYVLSIFFRPTPDRYGINQYKRSLFLTSIHGTAYRPFVYRALLPVTVQTIVSVTPQTVYDAFTAFVGDHSFTIQVFQIYQWETSAAYAYAVAALLMWLCLIGFGHYAASLTALTLNKEETPLLHALLAGSVLLALPAFFSYTSYIYDPPQLFLFTLGLYFLASDRIPAFLITFVFCAFNKETAILLIPLYVIVYHRQHSWKKLLGVSAVLAVTYVAIKLFIDYVYRMNNGPANMEFHLFPDNFLILTYGWTFTGLLTFLTCAFLLTYKWNDKPRFLKIALLCTLPILFGMTFFFGLLNEWRDYYEAYPIAFALIVDSLQRLGNALSKLERLA